MGVGGGVGACVSGARANGGVGVLITIDFDPGMMTGAAGGVGVGAGGGGWGGRGGWGWDSVGGRVGTGWIGLQAARLERGEGARLQRHERADEQAGAEKSGPLEERVWDFHYEDSLLGRACGHPRRRGAS